MSHPADIGAHVRQRRQALGLTLEQLAEASGVSPAMISEVERAVKNPTVKLAYQIALALGCSLTDLLEDDATEAPVVVRAAQRRTLIDPDTGVERHGLSPDLLRRGLELVWYALPAGQSAGEMAANRRGIVEHLVVIQGTLTIALGGESTRLAKGDGITYRPQTTVEYQNVGRSPCAFVLLSDSTGAD
jgi:transcriptional regulator with XRE-family HTH domain